MRSQLLLAFVATFGVACYDSYTGPEDPVASVTLQPGVRSLTPGQTLGLVASVVSIGGKPLDLPVTWSTSNGLVATVAATGVVTAVGEGTADITATVAGKSDVASIVVGPNQNPVPVASLALSHYEVDLEEGHNFTFTAIPRDAANNILAGRVAQWTSSNPEVASINPIGVGRVVPIKPGVTTITAKVEGKTVSTNVEVYAAYNFELTYEAAPNGTFQLDINDPAAVPAVVVPGPYASAKISPDGTKVVYVALGAGGHSTIWIAGRNGADPRRLTDAPGQNDQPSWSPEGDAIVYRHWNWQAGEGADIWKVNVVGPIAPMNLTPDIAESVAEPAWSPRYDFSTRIAFVKTNQTEAAVWTMAPNGADKRRITTGAADAQPAWSPDGLTLAFQRSGPATFGDLYLTDADGGSEAWVLVNLPQIQRAPSWSPDGSLIAFASGHEGGAEQIYTIAPIGNRLARRTAASSTLSGPAWVKK